MIQLCHANRLLTLSCSDSDSFLRLELLLWIVASSAKRSRQALMNRGKSLMSMEKSNGPRTEPWGTPYLRDRISVRAFTRPDTIACRLLVLLFSCLVLYSLAVTVS